MQAIVVEVISDDEFSIAVLWLRSREDCVESETDLLVDPFEEIFLRRFRNQSKNIPERIFL